MKTLQHVHEDQAQAQGPHAHVARVSCLAENPRGFADDGPELRSGIIQQRPQGLSAVIVERPHDLGSFSRETGRSPVPL